MLKNSQSKTPFNFSGIEWTIDPDFHFGLENAKYIEALIDDIKLLPIKHVNIEFSSNRWDFSPCFNARNSINLVFNFETIPIVFLKELKFYVLLSILNKQHTTKKLKISTICNGFRILKPYLKFLDTKGISSIRSTNNRNIIDYMNTKVHLSFSSIERFYFFIIKFYYFFKVNYNYKIQVDLKVLSSKRKEYQTMTSLTHDNNKTPDIPSDYFNKIVSLMIAIMRDSKQSYTYRSVACIYLIISQTGLRINEVLTLEIDSLKCISLPDLNIDADFLAYKNFKSSNEIEDFTYVDIFANKLTKEAFETLVKMRTTRSNKDGNSYIYLPDVKQLPGNSGSLNKNFHRLLFEKTNFSNPELFSYSGLHTVKVLGKGSVISPTAKQFRVHVCTALYQQGVPLLYIKKYMGHLSDEMLGYYVRPKTQKQEDAEFSNKLLTDLTLNQVSLLGNNAHDIQKNIDAFINTKDWDIKTDLKEIIEELNGQFVIRAKRGGVCIKTSFRECSKDSRTNEMFCAYNVCPNLFHFYYMCDVTLEDFRITQKTFQYNATNGHKLQASKELNKCKDICKRRLIPELQDLKAKIDLLGIENILQQHSNLSQIIFNYDEILEEVKRWTKKTF